MQAISFANPCGKFEMFSRLGFQGRIILIVLLVLLAFSFLAIGASIVSRGQDTNTGFRFPLPDQIASIADLLEREQGEARDVALRAVNSQDLRVTVVSEAPANSEQATQLPFAQWLVSRYMPAVSGREVRVVVDTGENTTRLERLLRLLRPDANQPLKVVVGLKSGELAVIETRAAPILTLLGLPTGFWIGVLGALLAALATFAIAREAKPLRHLAASVKQFSQSATPSPLQPTGAPELRSLIQSNNDMQQRIADLLRGRMLLLGGISHDLKTYLTRMRLRVEQIADPQQQARAIKDIDEMVGIIEDALSLVRGTEDKRDFQEVSLNALLREEISVRNQQKITLHGQAGAVIGSPTSLRRVFANILDNAARHAKCCDITLSEADGMTIIRFDDDGPGIAADQREAVFEPFNRLDASRSRQTGGSGLGLAIVRQIVSAHGGTVYVEKSHRGGVRLVVKLPRKQPKTEQ
jgi:two-component system, OmpR family, osmolarity sensor histidine kinase EnvZ